MTKKHDHHFLALIGLFLLLLSPVVWLVLGGKSLEINQDPTVAWAFLTTFAIVAYISFLAFINVDPKSRNKK